MNNAQMIVQQFLQHLAARDLSKLTMLFSENVDWYIPGDVKKAPWLGRRKNREEVAAFYKELWEHTEPLSAKIDDVFYKDSNVIIAGEFSTTMLPGGKVVDSPFFIYMKIEHGQIAWYRLLEDSYAVSLAMS